MTGEREKERESVSHGTRARSAIVLGTEATEYETTRQSFDRMCLGVGDQRPAAAEDVKKALRATHFVLGDEAPQYSTSNTFQDTRGNIDNYRGRLNEEAKKALLVSHVSMGNERHQWETSAKAALKWDQSYVADLEDRRQRAREAASVPKADHIVFGEEQNTFKSTSADSYAPFASEVVKTKLDKEVESDLRSTHFTLGNERTDYSTSNTQPDPTGQMSQYKAQLSEEARACLLESHVCLGEDWGRQGEGEKGKGGEWESAAKAAAVWDQRYLEVMKRNREDAKKFALAPKTCSIQLGSQPVAYESTLKSAFQYDKDKAKKGELAKEVAQDLKRSHFSLAADDSPSDYSTSNKLLDPTGEMHNYTVKLNQEARAQLRASHLSFGNDRPEFVSRSHAATTWDPKFLEGVADRKREAEKAKKVPKQCSIVLGDEAPTYLTSAAREFVYDKTKVTRNELNPALQKDLRSCHFSFGTEQPDYHTSNSLPDPTGRVHQFQAKLNADQRKQLLRSSVALGDAKLSYETTQQAFSVKNNQ